MDVVIVQVFSNCGCSIFTSVGEPTFAFARVLVRARIDRPSQQPNDTENHTTLRGPCSHAPLHPCTHRMCHCQGTGQSPTARTCSRTRATLQRLHVYAIFLCVTYTPAPPRLSALFCDMFLTFGHKDQDSEKSAIISPEDACRRCACQSAGCCEKKELVPIADSFDCPQSSALPVDTVLGDERAHCANARSGTPFIFILQCTETGVWTHPLLRTAMTEFFFKAVIGSSQQLHLFKLERALLNNKPEEREREKITHTQRPKHTKWNGDNGGMCVSDSMEQVLRL